MVFFYCIFQVGNGLNYGIGGLLKQNPFGAPPLAQFYICWLGFIVDWIHNDILNMELSQSSYDCQKNVWWFYIRVKGKWVNERERERGGVHWKKWEHHSCNKYVERVEVWMNK